MSRLKYVRLAEYNQVIIFPEIIKHDTFKHLDPLSAGFCWIDCKEKKVICSGESISLKIKSLDSDSHYATRQIFGDY